MKLTTLILSLILSMSVCSQDIIGLHLRWQGYLQDIAPDSELEYDNTTVVVFSDSSFRQVIPEDPFTWIWRLKKPTGVPGLFEVTVIDTAFQIKPSDHTDILCNGVFIIEVEAIHDDGRVWRCQGPAFALYTDSSMQTCDQIPGLDFSWFDENDYLTATQLIRTFTFSLWYVEQDYVGEIGDLDRDGDVDVSDLLMFIGVYGQ